MNFRKKANFNAPAVLFGVHGSAYLTPKLLARYSLEVFYLKSMTLNSVYWSLMHRIITLSSRILVSD